jgi:copper ion binding protein
MIEIVTEHLKVTGMSCGHCVARVEKCVGGLAGVKTAKVDLKSSTLTIEYDKGKLNREEIEKAVIDAGYGVG